MPDIKIKGYSGVELPFADVPKVWLAAPESTADNPILEPYTYGEALDGVEIEPDFSGGDMQVTVPEGYLLRSGVLKKPENLIPGNIKAGETIAGIPGEYEGNGGGGNESNLQGAFWETESFGSVSKYNQMWFDCNGERYAFSLTYTGGGNTGNIYKWVDEAWISVCSASISAYSNGEGAFALVMPSGKAYIFNSGNDGQYWYVFDGASFQSAPHTLPGEIVSGCIHNGLITGYFRDVGSIYSYSESDGWNLIAKISDKTYEYYYIASVNGELYAIKSNVVYKVADGSLSQVGETYRFSKILSVYSNSIIYLAQTGYTIPDMIRGYDVAENVDSLIGYGMGVQYGYMPGSNFSDGLPRCLVLKDGKGTYNVFSHTLRIVK